MVNAFFCGRYCSYFLCQGTQTEDGITIRIVHAANQGCSVKVDIIHCYGISLKNKTCSIIGLGTIGQVVAARAKQFGMRVMGIQRNPKNCDYADEVLGLEHLDRVLEEADFIVVLLPLTPQTRNLMNKGNR